MQEVKNVAKSIGMRFREGRRRKNLTLEKLGQATGLSSAFLSRLERGETSTSIANLIQIASAIDVPLHAIFEPKEIGPRPAYVLSKRQTRRTNTLLSGPGYEFERLQGRLPGQRLEAFELEYPVGPNTEIPFAAHGGEEVLYLLSGRIAFQVGTDRFELGAGDFVHLLGDEPHRGWNIGEEPARLLMVHLSSGRPNGAVAALKNTRSVGARPPKKQLSLSKKLKGRADSKTPKRKRRR